MNLPDDKIVYGEYFPEIPDSAALDALSDEDAACLAASAISSVSEDGWCAGWILGAGRMSLGWDTAGPVGQGEVTPEQAAGFRRLRARLGDRWVEWRGEGVDAGPALVPVLEIA